MNPAHGNRPQLSLARPTTSSAGHEALDLAERCFQNNGQFIKNHSVSLSENTLIFCHLSRKLERWRMQSHNHAGAGVGRLPTSDGSPVQLQPSRKRERNDTYDEPNNDHSSGARNEPDEGVRTSKRSRHVRTGNASAVLQPRCVVVHRVQCEVI
jgi:hypothetical protein